MNEQFISKLSSILLGLIPDKNGKITKSINVAEKETHKWESKLPAQTSEFNIRMYFIQMLSKNIEISGALNNETLISILLDDMGLKMVGDSILLNGKNWKVVRRKIGNRFGVELYLESETGETIVHEFFD